MKLAGIATCGIAALAAAGCASQAPSTARGGIADDAIESPQVESAAPFSALAAAITASSPPAPAADGSSLPAAVDAAPVAAPAEKWRFSATAFMWFAGLDAKTAYKGRSSTASLSFRDIWDNLDQSYMAHLEASKGRWSIFAEGIYMSLSDTSNGPRGRLDIDLTLKQAIATGAVAYKFVDAQISDSTSADAEDATRVTAEVYGGTRYNEIRAKINPKRLGSVRKTIDWWDPVVGVRMAVAFTPQFSLVTRGDVGGFSGTDDSSWFFMAGVEWKPAPCFGVGLGWAVLTQRYRNGNDPSDFSIKEKMGGPLLTATFYF